MQQGKRQKQNDPMLSFHLMKFAFQDFQKSACNLTHQEYELAYQHANEEMLLHQVILTSDEACCVVIPDPTLQQTLLEIIAEYPDEATFYGTLEENNMKLDEYRTALHNDLRVETILSRIASTVQSVTAVEVRRYYNRNKTEFNQPEQRSANLIQIRFNPFLPSELNSAYKKIAAIHRRVTRNPVSFPKEARLFSDCNTAKNDGNLGRLAAGELCPELDRVLFTLQAGETSAIIRNSTGFSIIQCSEIHPARKLSIKEASLIIFPILLKKKQLEACRMWLQKLIQPSKETTP
ncbi:parvulin-like peptidyl-prolyl isomerase [Desulfocapsa sulfexigens DSM 10523]|uniref:Parvulin-like peptidyl-prolyl isomerase n=1 Tax=Desulfocapsa sulfexigens (strain DSM 10523 / SB164P1) TaxID=1167006 RepID=M1P5X1_DESSD|nr:peptidylprolyl isomerase [Desulfocapsa sulfexigens]AGF77077.1 parvulin-like peptidyl-prolyl isomerase [Desulfocapsa sulfexigens DSM 10523]